MGEENCKSCWFMRVNEGQYECRKDYPGFGGKGEGIWPTVRWFDWCGNWTTGPCTEKERESEL